MIKIKKILIFAIKLLFSIAAILTVILFFYSALFYTPSVKEKKSKENEIIKEEKNEITQLETDRSVIEKQEEEKEIQKKINESKKIIKDSIFATVGNKSITKSEIVNEIKAILILNNMSYSNEKRNELQSIAIKQVIKRVVKEIEISKYDFLEFDIKEMELELGRMAANLNVDIDTLKNISESNDLDFEVIKKQIKTELLWNSLIFNIYSNRISVNFNEINEQLEFKKNKKEIDEYLLSEIIIQNVEKDKLESVIEEIKNKIMENGFESTAMSLSISKTATNGGDLGWINENEISSKFRKKITSTPINEISEPVLLNEGILFFKVREKRKMKNEVNTEVLKKQLINIEKNKILTMYSMSHYDNLRRSVSIKYFDD